MLVVLKDGCGFSSLVDFRGSNIDTWRNVRVWFNFFRGLH